MRTLNLLFVLVVVIRPFCAKIVHSTDICGDYNGRRIYLDLGSEGILAATNNTGTKLKQSLSQRQCSLELITCPSCTIAVRFTFLNISRNCGKNSVLDSCGCDYVWIYEPPFDDVSGEQFCGHFANSSTSTLVYKSQTRATAINFLFTSFHQHAFTLEYKAERNRQYFNGYPNRYTMNNTTNQYITSPFFPHLYPRDLNTEYVIKCNSPVELCRIRLIFTDFQLSTNSLIEFFDYNGQRLYVITGTLFRPSLITTNGPKMVIRFYANGGTNLGFRANYNYLLGETNSTLNPDTDCGGYVDNLGGAITMMNMLKEGTKAYDCFWIIRPPVNFLHLKTQTYVKVTTFSDFAGPTELVIRQGITSNEPVVEVLRHPSSQYVLSKQREHIVPINKGFYVSLKGLFRSDSRLAIIYSAFNYKDCYSGSDYLCRNMRCIPTYLACDGFDHCGDNSDEATTCFKEPNERMRWSHTPNFFFPKNDKYSYLKTATIVFVVCSIGLMTLIFTLVLILYRLNARNRSQRHLQNHLQTLNDMLEEGQVDSIIEEIIEPDDPPMYEPPPDYETILKIEKRVTKSKQRSRSRTSKKSSSESCSNQNAVVISRVPATSTTSNGRKSVSRYRSLPRIIITDVQQDKFEILSKQKQRQTTIGKHSSLENIFINEIPDRRRYLSLDVNTVKLHNLLRSSIELTRTNEALLRKQRQRCRFFSISESSLARNDNGAMQCLNNLNSNILQVNDKRERKKLRRSLSIENLWFSI